MKLPFLKNKNMGPGVSVMIRNPDEAPKDDDMAGLLACAQDLISAVQAGDPKGVAQAFKAAFELCEMYPEDDSAPSDESSEA